MKTQNHFWLKTAVALTAAFIAATSARADTKTKLLGFARWHEEGGYVWVVGGYDAGQKKWLNDSAAQKAFYPGTTFQLFGMEGSKGKVAIERAEADDNRVGFSAKIRRIPAGQDMAVAVAHVAKPMPRAPKKQSLDAELYRKAAASLLNAKGLKIPMARLQQHFRVDLNGDGIEEVLLGAQSRGEMGAMPTADKGDYSLVAIRFYDPSRKSNPVQVASLGVEIARAKIRFGAPLGYAILGVVDIDGDGKMEIITRYYYYEGEGIEVFRFDGHSVKSVFSAGWGA